MNCFQILFRYLLGPIATEGFRAFAPEGRVLPLLYACWNDCIQKWMARGLLGVFGGFLFTNLIGNDYFYAAGKQLLVAPYLWNMIVVLGLFASFFGGLAYALRLRRISAFFFRQSGSMLKFASDAGALGFGALFGLFCLLIYQYGIHGILEYLASVISVVLLIFVFFMNVLVWWVSYCLQETVTVPSYFVYLRQRVMLLASTSFAFIIILALITMTTTPHKRICRPEKKQSTTLIQNEPNTRT